MEKYLQATFLLDFYHASIQQLVTKKAWMTLPPEKRVKAVYDFVRDEIFFGYNISDDIPASQVLDDGYGQCNTKSVLLMALLRAVRVPSRIHGFTIDKALQKGAITGIWYRLSPRNILHSWVEVYVDEKWYILEGVILDKSYLQALQKKYRDCNGTFCGYGVYTDRFRNPLIDWDMSNTYIQSLGINQDFGLFDSPDDFYARYRQEIGFLKRFLFRNVVRHLMNKNVKKIRHGKMTLNPDIQSVEF